MYVITIHQRYRRDVRFTTITSYLRCVADAYQRPTGPTGPLRSVMLVHVYW